MRLTQIRERAELEGLDAQSLEAALDAVDPKSALIGLVVEPTSSGRRQFDVNQEIEAAVSRETGCMFLQLEAAEKSRSVDKLHLQGYHDGGDDHGDDYDRLAERVTQMLWL